MAGKLAVCKCRFGSPKCIAHDMCPSGILKVARVAFIKNPPEGKEKPDACNSQEPVFVKTSK
jgi:hypothetical protein